MTFEEQLEIATRLGVAALGGLAVGIEREWSAKVEGEHPRFAGVRTFLLIGLLGGIAAQLTVFGLAAGGMLILSASALLIVAAYTSAAFRGERESTTEFAALLVLGAGALAGIGKLAIASALNAFTALILVEKSRIHSLVYRMRSEELSAGFRFAVLALVVLPLLPVGPYGPPPGIRPRELWALVLLFSGISFAGFIARRVAGQNRGYFLTGLFGGLISSTAVTLNFSRESQQQPDIRKSLAYGVIAACTVLPVRAVILTTILNRAVGLAVIPYLVPAFLAGLVLLIFRNTEQDQDSAERTEPRNPLRLFAAIKLVIAFVAGLYAIRFLTLKFGVTGLFVTSGLVGAGDVDTLTFTIAKQQNIAPSLAAQALTFGIVTNTLLKLFLSLLIGRGRYRLITGVSLALLALTMIAGLLLSRFL